MKRRFFSRWGKYQIALFIGGGLVLGLLFAYQCCECKPKVELKWVEFLPGVCGPLPQGFGLYDYFKHAPIQDVVTYENSPFRYPERITVERLDDSANAGDTARVFIEFYCDCKWKKRIVSPEDNPHSIRFRDHWADSTAEMTYSLKRINGNLYFISAYSISCRNYRSVFETIFPKFQSCAEVDKFTPIPTPPR